MAIALSHAHCTSIRLQTYKDDCSESISRRVCRVRLVSYDRFSWGTMNYSLPFAADGCGSADPQGMILRQGGLMRKKRPRLAELRAITAREERERMFREEIFMYLKRYC